MNLPSRKSEFVSGLTEVSFLGAGLMVSLDMVPVESGAVCENTDVGKCSNDPTINRIKTNHLYLAGVLNYFLQDKNEFVTDKGPDCS